MLHSFYENIKNSIYKKIILGLIGFGMLSSFLIFLPQVRMFIITEILEKIKGGEIQRNYWLEQMGRLNIVLLFMLCCTTYFTIKWQSLIVKLKLYLSEFTILIKQNLFAFLFLLIIGLLALTTIIRANFYYQDDVYRITNNNRLVFGYQRYLAEIISPLVHMSASPSIDVAPLTQLIALFILCISIFILVYLFTGKITKLSLFAGLPLCFSPYFLENFSYRYDSINMALSIFFSLIPFLFNKSSKDFMIVSFFGLLAMTLTYQSSSGVYIVLVCMFSYKYWMANEKSFKEIIIFIISSTMIFVITLLFFRLFINVNGVGYVSNHTFSINTMVQGIIKNISIYFQLLNSDLNRTQKIFIGLIITYFFIANILSYKDKKKILVIITTSFLLAIVFPLSFGAYIILEKPLFAARSFIGVNILLAVIQIITINLSTINLRLFKFISVGTIILFSYSLITFAFSYGNALSEQKRWNEFKLETFLKDFSTLNREETIYLQIAEHSTADKNKYPATVKLMIKKYPILKRLVITTLSAGWITRYLLIANNFDFIYNDLEEINSEDFSLLNFPTLIDTSYHTIKGESDKFLLILK
ncbi:MAG: glucosyltransferase domain-containing protein [Treponemataceae bacterium]